MIDDLRVTCEFDGELVHLPLIRGMTALYGLNGAGKTRLLRRLRGVLTPGPLRANDFNDVLYGNGALQVRMSVGQAEPESPVYRVFGELCQIPETGYDWLRASEDPQPVVDLVPLVYDLALEAGRRRNVADSETRAALDDGVFLLCPTLLGHAGRPVTAVYLAALARSDVAAEVGAEELAARENLLAGLMDALEAPGLLDSWPADLTSPATVGWALPGGAAVPLCYLGCVRTPLFSVAYLGADIDRRDLGGPTWLHAVRSRRRVAREIGDDAWALPRHVPSDATFTVPGLKAQVDRYVDAALKGIAARANASMRLFFGEDAPVLDLVPPPELQIGTALSAPVRWVASDHGGRVIDIDHLGDAHRRYARTAIDLALSTSGDSSDVVSILLADEPERATHSVASATLGEALPRLADHVVVATHSVPVLDKAANLARVVRSAGASRVVRSALDLSHPATRSLAARAGLKPHELLALCRVVVLVEGPHDEAMISGLCDVDLKEARAVIVPLTGTSGIEVNVLNPMLLDA